MTAGELIRQALNEGETKLGLAKKIAGNTSDRDPEVRRWRDVINRAADGGEPQEAQASRIAEFFDVTVDRPRLGPRRDRLRALEVEVNDLTVALEASRRAHARLQRRVSALERSARLPQAEPATRRARSAG